MNKYLDISKEVKAALSAGKPVVALESTIISHGMPYPQNVETALAVEDIVRKNGAVPATIAIIGGRLKAGLTPDEIEYFGKKGPEITKASRRDLAMLCAKGLDGACTVTTTMMIAHMAGINIFATGGIGGVHRGPVIGMGTEDMPAFYTSKSGFKVDYKVDSPAELAAFFKTHMELGMKGGILVGNPIPDEYAMDPDVINPAIDKAIQECNSLGIKGKETTPFLLAKVKEITGGDSLESNIKLVFNNAEIAAKTACEFSKMNHFVNKKYKNAI